MPKRVQRLGHPSAQAQLFLGLAREITVDTTNKSLRVHDGINAGGFEMARADVSNVPAATGNNNGMMSIALHDELKFATSKNIEQDARLLVNEGDIDDLETFRNYFPNVTGLVPGGLSQNDLGLLSGKYTATQFLMRGKGTGSGDQTVIYKYNATAAAGWVTFVIDTNIRALFIDQNQTAASAGFDNPTEHNETVNITINFPAATAGHTLTGEEMPVHNHSVPAGGFGCGWSIGYRSDSSCQNNSSQTTGNAGGSGGVTQPHQHNIGGSDSDTDNVQFRPRYAKGHLYQLQN